MTLFHKRKTHASEAQGSVPLLCQALALGNEFRVTKIMGGFGGLAAHRQVRIRGRGSVPFAQDASAAYLKCSSQCAFLTFC